MINGPPPVVVLSGKREFNTCLTTLSSSGISSGGLFCTCLDSPIRFVRRGMNESFSKLPSVSNKFFVDVVIGFRNSSSSSSVSLSIFICNCHFRVSDFFFFSRCYCYRCFFRLSFGSLSWALWLGHW